VSSFSACRATVSGAFIGGSFRGSVLHMLREVPGPSGGGG
jgi:hypothetical protein